MTISLHPRWWADSVRTNAISELVSLFSCIHQFPRLETINLTFYPMLDNRVGSNSGGRRSLQAPLLGALATWQLQRPCAIQADVPLFARPTHVGILPSRISPIPDCPDAALRRLQLSVLYDIAPDDARWCNFWSTFFPRTIPAPTQHALTEFSLHSDMPIGSSSELSFVGLYLPRLYALSLSNFVLEPPVGIEPFILRHATTLTRLELLMFSLPITRLRPLSTSISPSVTLTRAEESDHSWDYIWDRFAVELTALVALHLDDCWYCIYGPNRCVWGVSVSNSCNAVDASALQRFRTIVAARSGEMDCESCGECVRCPSGETAEPYRLSCHAWRVRCAAVSHNICLPLTVAV
jgi:hypothetical protein